jgi:hypothetical protein
VASTFYTIRSGDATTPDATTYTPGRMTQIHLRVKDIAQR